MALIDFLKIRTRAHQSCCGSSREKGILALYGSSGIHCVFRRILLLRFNRWVISWTRSDFIEALLGKLKINLNLLCFLFQCIYWVCCFSCLNRLCQRPSCHFCASCIERLLSNSSSWLVSPSRMREPTSIYSRLKGLYPRPTSHLVRYISVVNTQLDQFPIYLSKLSITISLQTSSSMPIFFTFRKLLLVPMATEDLF